MLVVVETHPIQYHAPVYRILQQQFDVPVTAIYGSDFSIAGYRDLEFDAAFAWDSDLLSGHTAVFLSRVSQGGARAADRVRVRGLEKALRRVAPDAVLIVGYHPWFHQAAFYRARRAGLPILFRGETTDHAVRRSPLKGLARNHALRWFYRQCEGLLYVGKRSLEHFRRLGCRDEKLFFSPYCVDAQVFRCDDNSRETLRRETRQRLEVNDSQRVFLFSGKLSPRKGPELLLRAVREMPAPMRRSIVVAYVGSGELKGSLEALAEESPRVDVKFLGFQNQTQLSSCYHAADLLVLPSLQSETWGLVVNEALHHGVPCVVSNAVGCSPDLIEPGLTGDVCEVGAVGDLAAALQRAMALTGRPDVRRACRERVSAYTTERAAEGMARAYHAVVRSKGMLVSRR